MAENNDNKTEAKDPSGQPQNEAPKEPSSFDKLKSLLNGVKNSATAITKSQFAQSTTSKIKKFGLLGWMKVLTVFVVGFLTYGVYKTAPHWKKLWKFPYPSTLETVADQKYSYAPDTKVIRYSNDLLAPQHFVLINKIVVNIKPGKLSTANPMVAFDLYVRTDNEAASVEIRDREKQIQDHLQRFCEDLSYDQVQSEEGKVSWKNRMKRELNLVLTTGRVKEVFFKTLLVKP